MIEPAHPTERLAASVFVGRERVLEELRAGLEGAVAGRGRLFLIGGEPGIGKTRLADEVASEASRKGLDVLWGRCWEGGGAPAYWPWVQVVRAYARGRDTGALASRIPAGAMYLARMVPELRDRLSESPESPSPESDHARFYLFDSTTALLRNVANQTPLVIVLDDLHAADGPSLLLLQFLARELRDSRILVVGTYREAEVRRAPEVGQILGDLAREAEHIPLQGLGEPEVGRFIEKMVGIEPSDAVVRAVHLATGGNPLFVREVVRLLLSEGRRDAFAHAGLAIPRIPAGVREVIHRRLEPLSGDTLRTLSVASVIGQEFELSSLQRTCELPFERLLEALGEARAAGLLVETSSAVGRFRFAHALIRETLYDDLAPARRLELHRRIGSALEEMHGTDLEARLAEVAHHFFAAAPAGDARKAIEYARRAAERADAQLAYEEAARLYQMALRALELTEEADGGSRCELLLALGEAQRRAGNVQAANEAFLGAIEIGRTLGAGEVLARAVLGFGTDVVAPDGVDEPLVGLLEEALRSLPANDDALRVRVHARLGRELYLARSPERRLSLTAEAVEMARRLGEPATLAYALNSRHWALWDAEHVEERLAVAREFVGLAEEAGNRELAFLGHLECLFDLLEVGDIELVDAETTTCSRLAKELRQPGNLWMIRSAEAARAHMDGRFEDAERLGQEAFTIGQRGQDANAAQCFAVQLYALRRDQGRLGELEGSTQALAVEQNRWIWRPALARLYMELGRETEARREVERLARHGFADLPRDYSWLFALANLAPVAAFLDDRAHAANLYDLLLPYANRCAVGGPATVCEGAVARYLGLLATTMERFAEAEAHFAAALEMNTRLGALPSVAYTRHDFARMLLSRGAAGDPATALDLVNDALVTAQELGMEGLVERALGLTREAEGRGAGTVPVGGAENQRTQPRSRGLNVFRKDGDYWTIAHGGTAFRLRDARGLRYIARLLLHPGREFHVLDLVAAATGPDVDRTPDPARTTGTARREGARRMVPSGDAGEVLDARARADYERRLSDLRAELSEAERFNDSGRAAKTREEIDFIVRQLSSAFGLGGRSRRAASIAERARVNVRNSIADALKTIRQHDASLWLHLRNTVKTGTFCSYVPERPVSWDL